jgi:hypothetical protein
MSFLNVSFYLGRVETPVNGVVYVGIVANEYRGRRCRGRKQYQPRRVLGLENPAFISVVRVTSPTPRKRNMRLLNL